MLLGATATAWPGGRSGILEICSVNSPVGTSAPKVSTPAHRPLVINKIVDLL